MTANLCQDPAHFHGQIGQGQSEKHHPQIPAGFEQSLFQQQTDDGEQGEQGAQGDHGAERDERGQYRGTLILGNVPQAGHRGVEIVISQKAQDAGQAPDLDLVAFMGFVGDGEKNDGGLGLGFPVRLHGRQFSGLGFGHVHGVHVAGDHDHQGGDQPDHQADIEGAGEKFDVLFLEQMPGADAHDEEGAEQEGRRNGMNDFQKAERVGHHCQEIGQLGTAAANRIAHRLLHPAVGQKDPDRRNVAGRGHQPHDRGMGLFGDLVPAEDPDTDEGRFQEKGQRGLDGQQGPEDVAHIGRVTGPVGPELEFEGNPCHHAQGEVDEKKFAPEFGHAQIGLIPGFHVSGLHVGHQHGQSQGEGHKQKMEHGSGGELEPG
ncbi:conserved hypothetical protein [Desulfosarcina cetonica]|nr:conserved hypothetical protein [Desulfosarcina cetonica]